MGNGMASTWANDKNTNNQLFVWSRGEELMTDKISTDHHCLKRFAADGTVLDGEIIPSLNKSHCLCICCKQSWQKNVTKKKPTGNTITFFAYDLIEYNHEDW